MKELAVIFIAVILLLVVFIVLDKKFVLILIVSLLSAFCVMLLKKKQHVDHPPKTGGKKMYIGGIYKGNKNKPKDDPYDNNDFKDEPYDESVDDQTHLVLNEEEQTFLHKDYADNVQYAFPKFLPEMTLPSKYAGMTHDEVNTLLADKITVGKNCNWDNKSLSYMRKDVQGKRLMKCAFKPLFKILGMDEVHFVDATANIGGNTLLFAMQDFVKSVKSYDLDPCAVKMLRENVSLYGYDDKIEIVEGRFDYKIPKDSVVSVDPPFEQANNKTNFNLSIEMKPLHYVVEDILNAGAKVVLLELPVEYRYNSRYARDHGQHVVVYIIPQKNIKIYAVSHDPKVGNFNRFLLVRNLKSDNMYDCFLQRVTSGPPKKKVFYKKFEDN